LLVVTTFELELCCFKNSEKATDHELIDNRRIGFVIVLVSGLQISSWTFVLDILMCI